MSRIARALSFLELLLLLGSLLRPPTRRTESFEPLYLPRASILHAFGKPILPAIVDYYWLESLQTLGGAATAAEFRSLADYGNLISDLDSRFTYPNRFLGGAIPFDLGREQWVNTAESTALMTRALSHASSDYYLRVLLAYNLSYFDKKYQEAAQLLEEASRIPNCPLYVRALATRLYAHAGHFENALAFAQSLAATSTDPEQRELFKRRISEIQLERELRRVEEAAARFRSRTGRSPGRVETLVEQGDLAPAPSDPLGGTISLDERGVAHSTSEQKRLAPFAPDHT